MQAQHAELKKAFADFGAVSGQLTGAFQSLQTKVEQLNGELAVVRQGRNQLAARLAALVEGLPGGVLLIDAQGEIQECNPAARELLGDPLLGERLNAVIARNAVTPPAAGASIEFRNGRFVNISRRDLGSGGEECVLIADVTEAHLLQLLMARQQRLLTLGELAAALAHQIRTPLAAAMLYASQMILPGRSAEDLVRCGAKTSERLKELDKLIKNMLEFVRGAAHREVVSVAALLEQVAQWLRPVLRSAVTLTLRTEAPDLAVCANAPSLVSAILNLATNALQGANGAMTLELLARRGGAGRAQMVISDDGPGIAAELRERIFEPYFTTRARGTGLGLAIVKSVVEAHGGSVWLADTAKGASFVIDLPAEH